MNKVKFVNEVKKLEIKDGDIVVLKTDRILKNPQFLRDAMKEIFKEMGIELKNVLILEDGMDIGVIEC